MASATKALKIAQFEREFGRILDALDMVDL
jgi:hypothetical protein